MSAPKIKTEHKPDICGACGPMLRCRTCNNNCCNGGSGEVDGKKCQDCLDCYEVQDLWWKEPDAVEFVRPWSYAIRPISNPSCALGYTCVIAHGGCGRSLEGEEYKKALDEYKKGDDARILGFLMRHKDCHLA